MEALHGARSSSSAARRQSEAARKLHNQVGHAFRTAKKHAGHTKSWRNGSALAKYVAAWAKLLDAELAATDDCKQVAHKQPEIRLRELATHPSDVTTAAGQDDDTVSCATTELWEQPPASKRKPRHRPARRARRRERLLEQQQLSGLLAKSADNEWKLESGQVSLFAMDGVASFLEQIDEDIGEALHFDWDDVALISDGRAMPQPTFPVGVGVKRKLEHVDFDDVEAGGDLSSDQEIHTGMCSSSADFFPAARCVLGQLHDVLAGDAVSNLAELANFKCKVRDCLEEVSFLCESSIGNTQVRDAIALLQEQVIHRDLQNPVLSHSLLKWFRELDACLPDFHTYSDEDVMFFWADIADEMANQCAVISYCLEAIEEIFLTEEPVY